MTLEEIRIRYLADQSLFRRLAAKAEAATASHLHQHGIRCVVEGRAKEVPSLLKKALRKNRTYEAIEDKCGVRVIATYRSQMPAIEEVLPGVLNLRERDDKAETLAPEELGYLGIHYKATLKATTLSHEEAALVDVEFELQLHTRAQNLWALVDHESSYKPVAEVSSSLKRRVYRLVALLELFDDEIDRIREEARMAPNFEEGALLDELEAKFYPLTAAKPYDRELSLVVLAALKDLYTAGERAAFGPRLQAFLDQHGDKLSELLAAYGEDSREHLLLSQPELLLILERIESAPHALMRAWTEVLPDNILEQLAAIWGKPL